MPRKSKLVTIKDENRDKGKTFLIKEASALQTEKWAIRALLAVARSGVDLPENVSDAGLAGLAQLALRAVMHMSFAEAEPLLEEMMACVWIIPDLKGNPEFSRPLVQHGTDEDDIEEVATRALLRREVFELHSGFSLAGDR